MKAQDHTQTQQHCCSRVSHRVCYKKM